MFGREVGPDGRAVISKVCTPRPHGSLPHPHCTPSSLPGNRKEADVTISMGSGNISQRRARLEKTSRRDSEGGARSHDWVEPVQALH